MERTDFTIWLLTEGLQLPKDDPVYRYAAHVNRDVEWPCSPSYLSFEQVEAHHRKFDNRNEDHLAGVLYAAQLAWKDFEKWSGK